MLSPGGAMDETLRDDNVSLVRRPSGAPSFLWTRNRGLASTFA